MDAIVVGIDVSKNQLDVHVRGLGESFAVARDAEGLAALIERPRPMTPRAIGLEATGGFETFVAAGKPKIVALIAVAKKLLVMLNAIIRDAKPWRAKHA